FRRERLWKAHMTAGLLLYEDLKTGELFRIQRYSQRRRGARFWQDGNAEPAMVAMAGSGTGLRACERPRCRSSSRRRRDRKSTRLNSSHVKNSYGVVCLQKK